jgi:hypothetical protein
MDPSRLRAHRPKNHYRDRRGHADHDPYGGGKSKAGERDHLHNESARGKEVPHREEPGEKNHRRGFGREQQTEIDDPMPPLTIAARHAIGEMLLVIHSHFRSDPRDVITPPRQDLTYDSVDTLHIKIVAALVYGKTARSTIVRICAMPRCGHRAIPPGARPKLDANRKARLPHRFHSDPTHRGTIPAGHGPVSEVVPLVLVDASPVFCTGVIGVVVVVVACVVVVELGALVVELGVLIVVEVALAGALEADVALAGTPDVDVVVDVDGDVVVVVPVVGVMPGEGWIPGCG